MPRPRNVQQAPRARGNSSIETGTHLLSVIARFSGPITLGAIAEAAGLTPSRTYRYLRGLPTDCFRLPHGSSFPQERAGKEPAELGRTTCA